MRTCRIAHVYLHVAGSNHQSSHMFQKLISTMCLHTIKFCRKNQLRWCQIPKAHVTWPPTFSDFSLKTQGEFMFSANFQGSGTSIDRASNPQKLGWWNDWYIFKQKTPAVCLSRVWSKTVSNPRIQPKIWAHHGRWRYDEVCQAMLGHDDVFSFCCWFMRRNRKQ